MAAVATITTMIQQQTRFHQQQKLLIEPLMSSTTSTIALIPSLHCKKNSVKLKHQTPEIVKHPILGLGKECKETELRLTNKLLRK